MTFLLLFYEFFKVGLFSVGGGLATIPFLRRIAERYPWFTVEELSDMIAVSESTPGPVGINMATYAGYRAGFSYGGVPFGILGGIVATLGILCPAIVVICLVSRALTRFRDSALLKSAFYGIRPAVAGLIGGAMVTVYQSALFRTSPDGASTPFAPALVIFAVLTALYFRFNRLHPVLFIAAGAAVGILLRL